MKTWPKLRAAGICVLTTALTVTVTQVVTQSPARAEDPPPEPVTVITSPPLNVPVQPPQLIVQKHEPVGQTTPIVVTNPGGTSPTAQECIPLDTGNEIFCLGVSGDALYPSGVFLPPFKVTNGFTAPGDLPGDKMDWIIGEAYAATADAHGVANDDLIKAYARPETRAYVHSRMLDIINKKLYGQPMTTQENQAYLALEDHFRTSQVKSAKAALYEYDRWSGSPCTYVPPTPPLGMAFVANPVIGTAGCSQANKYDLFRLTKGTPPAETFEKWAAYRNPSALVANANDPRIRYMIGKTQEAIIAVGALGVAAAAGVGIGIGVAASATVAAATAAASLGETAVASTLSLGASAAAAGPAIIFAIAIIIISVAISQMEADAAPGEQIRDRVARSAANTDPLGVRARIADYAGLNFLKRHEPAGQDPAIVHNDAFTDGLEAQIAEWMLFDQGGDRLDDPVLGYMVTESAPDDIHFAVNGESVDFVSVKAPPGALDRDAHPVSDYAVLFSRNWPMVAERRADTGAWSPYRARLALTYVDQDGNLAQMSLVRHKEGNGAPKIDFNLVRPGAAVEADRHKVATEWTFTKTGGGLRTVSLLPFDTRLDPVNVVPSVQGIMIADNTVKLSANLSTPGQSLPGTYGWTLERLKDDGTVAETIPVSTVIPNPAKRLTEPGRYRATASYTVTGPPAFTRSGVIEFTMNPPAPEIGRSDGFNFDAKIRDERVLNGSLFLDLRMLQATDTDDFEVKVDWADDGRGNVVSKTYDVHCQDSDPNGDIPTCDTGPMILPETAPTNENWSESPVFRIPDDQDFLPNVNVTITNGYGQVVKRSFPIKGDHRPTYATMTPHAEMAAGTTSSVDVVEVFPSPLLTESQDLTIFPYISSIVEQLPPGLTPQLDERNGRWFLQVVGTPQADAIGTYVFYFPFEQEPLGKALRPAPALASLEIKAATEVGYRSVLRGAPTVLADRVYRNVYPDYQVQVAQELPAGEKTFGTFTGKVMCKLVVEHFPVFDKPCANNKRFPWPAERLSGTMEASTYLVSATQPLADEENPYTVSLAVKFVDPTVTQVAGTEMLAKFKLVLRDLNPVQPPYTGYTVTCSQDGRAFAPCFAGGALSLLRTPGKHTLDVRAAKGAPDAATTTVRFPWSVATPAKTLGLKVPTTKKKRGTKIAVTGSLMLPGESYTIRIGGVKVGTGKATSAGTFSRTVKIPSKFKTKKYTVLLTGATTARKAVKILKVRR